MLFVPCKKGRQTHRAGCVEFSSGLGPEGRGSLEDYQECRAKSLDMSDPEQAEKAFSTFFCLVDTFMRAVNGKSHASDSDMRTKTFQETLMTPSTEAYVLFILEDKWKVFEKMEEGKSAKRDKGEIPAPKYTLAAAKCSKGNSLNGTGIRRFAVLHTMVRDARRKDGNGEALEKRVQQQYQRIYVKKRRGSLKEATDEAAVQEMFKDTVCEVDEDSKRAMFRNITAV